MNLFKIPRFSINICFFVLSITLAILLMVLAFIYLRAYFRDDIVIEITGRSELNFRVFYVENNIFDTNPVPNDLHFFMSYTDFIEVDSSFWAQFGQEVYIYYEYTATKRLIVRYMSTVGSNINPIVFHKTIRLSQISGNVFSNSLNLPRDDPNPRDQYTIFPAPHIEHFLEVAEDQARQVAEEGILNVSMRGFLAELVLDFTYAVWVPSLGFHHTLTQGYLLPLSSEVYGLTVTGTPYFSDEIIITRGLPFEVTLPTIIGFVAAVTLSGYGILNGIRHILEDPNKKHQEVKTLLRKYGNEIITSPDPINLSLYSIVRVDDFSELIKLAINLNKHIRHNQDEDGAIFTVTLDGDAYLYQVHYHRLFNDDNDSSQIIDTKSENLF